MIGIGSMFIVVFIIFVTCVPFFPLKINLKINTFFLRHRVTAINILNYVGRYNFRNYNNGEYVEMMYRTVQRQIFWACKTSCLNV